AIGDTVSSRSAGRPRVAGDLGLFVSDAGVPIVRRAAFDVPLNLRGWYDDPPGFADDDAGNAVIANGPAEVLLSSDDRQSVLSVPGASSAAVVHVNGGWVMVYTREIAEAPYMHASRVFIRPLDFTPSRSRPSHARYRARGTLRRPAPYQARCCSRY